MKNFELLVRGRFIADKSESSDVPGNLAVAGMKFCKLITVMVSSEIVRHLDSAFENALEHEIDFREHHNGLENKEREIYELAVQDDPSVIPGELNQKLSQKSIIIGSDGYIGFEANIVGYDHGKMIFENDQGTADLLMAYDSTLEQKEQSFKQMFICKNASDARDVFALLKSSSIDLTSKTVHTAWMDESGKLWPRNQLGAYAVSTNMELYTLSNDCASLYKENDFANDARLSATS